MLAPAFCQTGRVRRWDIKLAAGGQNEPRTTDKSLLMQSFLR